VTIADIKGKEHTSVVAEDEIEGDKVEVLVVKKQRGLHLHIAHLIPLSLLTKLYPILHYLYMLA